MSTTLKFQYNDDIRRATIPNKVTFEELISKIQSIYKTIPSGWKSICVKYLDDEGDLVTVTTTEELLESFYFFSKNAATLKFFISFVYPVVSCDISENPRPMQKYRQLHALAFQHMDNKDFAGARECFQEQLQHGKNEWQARVPYYNIACCESLLGNVSTAFEFLQKAVSAGFRNCKKLLIDPDLENLRESSPVQFQSLLEELKKDSGKCWRHKFNKEESGDAPAPDNHIHHNQEIKTVYRHRRSESEDLTKHCKWARHKDETQHAENENSKPWKKRFVDQDSKNGNKNK